MRNNTGKNKTFAKSERERFMNILQKLADSPPASSPFTYEGAQEWREWAEACRSAERAIEECDNESLLEKQLVFEGVV